MDELNLIQSRSTVAYKRRGFNETSITSWTYINQYEAPLGKTFIYSISYPFLSHSNPSVWRFHILSSLYVSERIFCIFQSTSNTNGAGDWCLFWIISTDFVRAGGFAFDGGSSSDEGERRAGLVGNWSSGGYGRSRKQGEEVRQESRQSSEKRLISLK